MEQEITCPSGLRGIVRTLKMRDIEAISKLSSTHRGDFIKRVLDQSWAGVTDPGPYVGDFTWPKALLGDAFYAFVQARIVTFGSQYQTGTVCPRCLNETEQTLELDQLGIRALPEESKARYRDGKLFTVAVEGTEVGLKLLTLQDERGIGMLMENRKITYLLATLAQRTVTLGGKNVIPGEALRFYEPLDGGLISEFDAFVEELECGVDTNIACTCSCGVRYKHRLPLTGGFFSTVVEPGKERRFTLTG